MITGMALAVVVVLGLYMLALGAASLFAPAQASRFLLGFATSPAVHFAELALRLIAGAALVLYAPNMFFSFVFQLLGWVLFSTAVCLLVLPWQWHRRFAQQAVPLAARYISLIGLASLSFGGFVLFAVTRGNAA